MKLMENINGETVKKTNRQINITNYFLL
uniref:Uncharacterized protein n=1 Tax=Anguilla anguilla TaxID=7936 RepID=A0A0E9UPS7_ANGAN